MKLKILIRGGNGHWPEEIALFETSGSSCMIGRKDCDLSIEDAYCSQRHALLYEGQDGALYLRDLQSTNGTFVGGTKVQDTRVQFEDIIRIGRTEMQILDYRIDARSPAQHKPHRIAPPASQRERGSITHTRRWKKPLPSREEPTHVGLIAGARARH